MVWFWVFLFLNYFLNEIGPQRIIILLRFFMPCVNWQKLRFHMIQSQKIQKYQRFSPSFCVDDWDFCIYPGQEFTVSTVSCHHECVVSSVYGVQTFQEWVKAESDPPPPCWPTLNRTIYGSQADFYVQPNRRNAGWNETYFIGACKTLQCAIKIISGLTLLVGPVDLKWSFCYWPKGLPFGFHDTVAFFIMLSQPVLTGTAIVLSKGEVQGQCANHQTMSCGPRLHILYITNNAWAYDHIPQLSAINYFCIESSEYNITHKILAT